MLNGFRKLDIRRKLVAGFVLISIIPLIIAISISTWISHNSLVNQANEYNKMVAVDFSKQIDQIILDRLSLFQGLSQTGDVRSMDKLRQEQALKAFNSKHKEMPRMFITDSKGQIVAVSSGAIFSLADRKYFQEIQKGADYSISDVMVSAVNGSGMITICVPIKNDQGDLIGTVGAGIDLRFLSQAAAEKKIGQSGDVFVTDKDGKVLAHPDGELVKSQADFTSISAVRKALKKEEGVDVYDYKGTKMAAYTFVPLTNWAVVAEIPREEALADATKVKNMGIGLVLIMFLLSLMVGIIFAGVFVKPIKHLATVAAEVAEGNLSKAITVGSEDELGQLAGSFDNMRIGLRKLIGDVQDIAQQLAASSQELSASAGQSAESANQVMLTITEVAEGAEKQLQSIDAASTTVEQMWAAIQQIVSNSDTVERSSDKTALAAKEGLQAVDIAIGQMGNIEKTVNNSAQIVARLGDQSKKIGNITAVIAGIAGQTNLLALNAAIEAARAGEQGRGFAVVAEEVRKLAEQSQDAAKQIASLIVEIQTDTAEAVLAMNEGTKEVKIGTDVVNNAEQSFKQIAELVGDASGQIKEISTAIQQLAVSSQQIVLTVKEIDRVSANTAGHTQTVSAATEEQSASIEQIAANCEDFAQKAEELKIATEKFRV